MLRGLIIFCLVAILAIGADAANSEPSFKLQAVRSKEMYGPFVFKSDKYLKIESGIFELNIVSGRSFQLIEPGTGKKFGVYEFVPGRMIDIGNMLYTITDIKSATPSRVVPTHHRQPQTPAQSKSIFDGMALGLKVDLMNKVKYDWEINGDSGDSEENMERTSAALTFSKNYINARIGLVTSAEWDNKIIGDGSTFENATIEEGTGWFVGIGVKVPVFQDGYWEGSIFGETSYRKEALSLQYGAWEIESVVTATATNGSTNVTTTTNYDYTNYDEDATLTEILVMLGAEISYETPAWFIYAGLEVLPWSDTTLDATIVSGDSKFDITFERNDPVMAYGGGGFNLGGIKYYLEVEGGGVMAVRLGLLKEL